MINPSEEEKSLDVTKSKKEKESIEEKKSSEEEKREFSDKKREKLKKLGISDFEKKAIGSIMGMEIWRCNGKYI